MSSKQELSYWIEQTEFKLAEPEEPSDLCDYAKPFSDWCEQLVATTNKNPTDITVNVAILDLVTTFFNRYEPASLTHKAHASPRSNKRCLFDLFRETYLTLNELRLTITPPRLREPPKPPAPQLIQPDDILLGEIVGEGLSDIT